MNRFLTKLSPLFLILVMVAGCVQPYQGTLSGETAEPEVKKFRRQHNASDNQPRVALPSGIQEIQPSGLQKLMDQHAEFVLIDARPENLYQIGHIHSAVNLPPTLYPQRAGSVLPRDKNKLIIVYCCGPT